MQFERLPWRALAPGKWEWQAGAQRWCCASVGHCTQGRGESQWGATGAGALLNNPTKETKEGLPSLWYFYCPPGGGAIKIPVILGLPSHWQPSTRGKSPSRGYSWPKQSSDQGGQEDGDTECSAEAVGRGLGSHNHWSKNKRDETRTIKTKTKKFTTIDRKNSECNQHDSSFEVEVKKLSTCHICLAAKAAWVKVRQNKGMLSCNLYSKPTIGQNNVTDFWE